MGLAKVHDRRLPLNAEVAFQIDDAQYRGGRAFQNDWERAERGPQAIDPTCDYVDGGRQREAITDGQRRAVMQLNRAERELGADGSALVHDVLIHGMTMDQVGRRRCLTTQRWRDYFARRFCECLDRLALIYGFATAEDRNVGRGWRSGAVTPMMRPQKSVNDRVLTLKKRSMV
jgi:hypothetical protein